MKSGIGWSSWGRKGVVGERGAGRNSEGRILNGELPSMGTSMTHLGLFGESMGFC